MATSAQAQVQQVGGQRHFLPLHLGDVPQREKSLSSIELCRNKDFLRKKKRATENFNDPCRVA